MAALRGIEGKWNDIGKWLSVPEETREEIRSQHSTDSDRLRAVILYVLTLHPRSSWRCVINALHWMEEHQVAERIQDYSEPVTGMHIKDIATIPCGVRLLSNDWKIVLLYCIIVIKFQGRRNRSGWSGQNRTIFLARIG